MEKLTDYSCSIGTITQIREGLLDKIDINLDYLKSFFRKEKGRILQGKMTRYCTKRKNGDFFDELTYVHEGCGLSKIIFSRRDSKRNLLFQRSETARMDFPPKVTEGDKGYLAAFFQEYQQIADDSMYHERMKQGEKEILLHKK